MEVSAWDQIIKNTSDTDVNLLTDDISNFWVTVVVDDITIVSLNTGNNVKWGLVKSNARSPNKLVVLGLWWAHLWIQQRLSRASLHLTGNSDDWNWHVDQSRVTIDDKCLIFVFKF